MPSQESPTRPVSLVTGAGSGIGLATARLLAVEGYDLVLVGRRASVLADAEAALRRDTPNVGIHTLAADIGDPDAAARIIAGAIEHSGRLDALVNNAGLAPRLPIGQTTPAVLRETFAVNAIGPGALIAACWPHFTAKRSGVVVNISTMGTADPFAGFFAYAAAKSAANSFARSIAKEGEEHNIRAFAIAPGAVETPMLRALFDESAVPPSSALSPDDIARVVVDCVLGRRDDQNGATIFVPSPA